MITLNIGRVNQTHAVAERLIGSLNRAFVDRLVAIGWDEALVLECLRLVDGKATLFDRQLTRWYTRLGVFDDGARQTGRCRGGQSFADFLGERYS